MPPLVYLDTARLGQMSPAAREAQLDFVRMTAEEPSSLYFEDFLRNGFSAWPKAYQDRFPSLHTWPGVTELKGKLRQLARAPADRQVLLANRSLTLVKLGVRCQMRLCRNVLATDMSWRTYQQALDHRAAGTGKRVTTVPLREQILRGGWTARDVAEYLAAEFAAHRCDGLFLPAVDHLGIRLPVEEIVRRIEQIGELRFVLVDAAQAFCHVSIAECFDVADFVVAGAHKWLHAYRPMGIGFFGRGRSRETIGNQLAAIRSRGETNDPLLDFTEQLEADDLRSHFETADLGNLFAVAGAAHDARREVMLKTLTAHIASAASKRLLRERRHLWRPLRPHRDFWSRIRLFEPVRESLRRMSADAIRRYWLSSGCILSAYARGLTRVSTLC